MGRDLAQWFQRLPCKCEVLRLSPGTTHTQKRSYFSQNCYCHLSLSYYFKLLDITDIKALWGS